VPSPFGGSSSSSASEDSSSAPEDSSSTSQATSSSSDWSDDSLDLPGEIEIDEPFAHLQFDTSDDDIRETAPLI
jgi:hypothetical protein